MPRGIFTRKPRHLRPVIDVIGPSISYVSLTRGMFSVIESDDARRVSRHSWSRYFDKRCNRYEAHAKINGQPVTLHRFLTGAEVGTEIDHKNGCTLDNRRQGNLRFAAHSQNQANQKRRSDSSSGFKGVFPHHGGFEAYVRCNGIRHYAGYRKTAKAAHVLYCAKARELFGEFARFE